MGLRLRRSLLAAPSVFLAVRSVTHWVSLATVGRRTTWVSVPTVNANLGGLVADVVMPTTVLFRPTKLLVA